MRCVISLIVCLLLALVAGCSSDKGSDPEEPPGPPPGTSSLWADSVVTIAGNQAKVDIYVQMHAAMQSIQIPLRIAGDGIRIDSVSFRFAILGQEPFSDDITIDNSAGTVGIIREYVAPDLVAADSGLLLSLFVTLDDTMLAQTVEVDTASGIFQIVDEDGITTVPEFGSGLITVYEKSIVWVEGIEAIAPGFVRVDVNAITRSVLQGIQLPLAVSGTRFYVDSISTEGTLVESGEVQLETTRIDRWTNPEAVEILLVRTYYQSAPVEPDSGRLLSIYLELFNTAEPHVITIDSTRIENASLSFADTVFGLGSVPFFTSGQISVSPASN